MADVKTWATEISRINERAAVMVQLGNKAVSAATVVHGLKRSRIGKNREVTRLGQSRHVGVVAGVNGDAAALGNTVNVFVIASAEIGRVDRQSLGAKLYHES